LFTTLSALSLLPFAAVVVMWVRSYIWWDGVTYQHGLRDFMIVSDAGAVLVLSTRYDSDPEYKWRVTSGPAGVSYEAAGRQRDEGLMTHLFRVGWDSATGSFWGMGYKRSLLSFGYAYAAILALATAVFSLIGYVRRRRRHSPNLCARCGYDLRATPGRCPECGTAVSGRDGIEGPVR
jgi:hypothetical protein